MFASSGLARAPTGLQGRGAYVGAVLTVSKLRSVSEDAPVNQSVFDTLTKKSLGQRQETGTPGLRDQMVPKSSGEGLCSDGLADLGGSQLGDPAPRVSDRPPECLDGRGHIKHCYTVFAINPAESFLVIVATTMPRAVLPAFMLTQVPAQISPPNQGQSRKQHSVAIPQGAPSPSTSHPRPTLMHAW